MYCSRRIALFACLMSTHIRILPGCLGFGATTTGDIHRVGPSTRSITLLCSSISSCSVVFSHERVLRDGVVLMVGYLC